MRLGVGDVRMRALSQDGGQGATVIEVTTCDKALVNDVTRLTSFRGAALIRCVFIGISSKPMPTP